MRYYCNPVNFGYKYQFNRQQDGSITASREAADPSMILFKGRYYIYLSMTCGFLYSDDMVHWEFHPLKDMPVYDYAPDVRVVGEYIYFCAANHEKGVHYRTKDPFSDVYERVEGGFPFWDPNLFADDDGRIYFYWGSSPTEPLYGIELDAETMKPIGERQELVYVDDTVKGFERSGENHIPERTPEEKEAILKNMQLSGMPEFMIESAKAFILGLPYIEGVWVNKHEGRYYLQYGTPGSRFNIYGDGVYVSENPLGPYRLANNNSYSYKPGGFLPAAGHGSTMEDKNGNVWHTATMRICVNHNFERRIGIWPAGWDEDGELFCNQRYGDWPCAVEKLPYGQAACVSGLRVFELGHEAPPVQASEIVARRDGDLDMEVSWQGNAVGYVVEWGYTPDKLYHSYQVYADSVCGGDTSGKQENYLRIGALVKGQAVYVRVDSFNESGITIGEVVHVTERELNDE